MALQAWEAAEKAKSNSLHEPTDVNLTSSLPTPPGRASNMALTRAKFEAAVGDLCSDDGPGQTALRTPPPRTSTSRSRRGSTRIPWSRLGPSTFEKTAQGVNLMKSSPAARPSGGVRAGDVKTCSFSTSPLSLESRPSVAGMTR